MQERRIDVEDGKYTFVLKSNDYRVHVLRGGEPWHIIEQGCNAVWALVALAVDMKGLTAAIERWAHVGDGALQHQELLAAFSAYLNERGESQRGLVTEPIYRWRIDDPPRGARCLVTIHPPGGGPTVLIATASRDHDSVRWHHVTAWMPLPEPFK